MAKLAVNEIQELARQMVRDNPDGIRFKQLVWAIEQANPETPRNRIWASVQALSRKLPDKEIVKPSPGLYAVAAVVPMPPSAEPSRSRVPAKVKEEDFYQPFADYLENELEEATAAIALGGAGLQKKWGTPDVVGVYKPLASHRIKFDLEIIAAEIKIDPQTPVVAFGQAAAYRLFAAKSYIVMPASVSEDDYSRLEALCMLFGIGLVMFDTKIDEPDFRIRVRAQRFSPDMFYVNEFAERVYRIDPAMFDKLFG
jgi:hypothetical protein